MIIKLAASSQGEFLKRIGNLIKSRNYPLGSAETLMDLHSTASKAISKKIGPGSHSQIRGNFFVARDMVKDFYGNKDSINTFKQTMGKKL